jgi:murein DD-endopeptidase MepM/ murein hydrolase activator NlpD
MKISFKGIARNPLLISTDVSKISNCLAVLLILASCTTKTQQPVQVPQSFPAKELRAALLPSRAAPTAVLVAAAPLLLDEQEEPAGQSLPPPSPLEFVFPTAAPAVVSLWRPPLYPTPWEPTPNDHFYFTRPIGANEVNWPLAKYRYGYLLYAEPHTGIDIPAPKGTPIMAAGPGVIMHAGYGLYFMRDEFKDPYGIAVAIKHDFGYRGQVLYTIYGHLDTVNVYLGQRVKGGEVIGTVGETGRVSGPHLHFEVRMGDNTFFKSRNPELWIAPPQGWGVLVGRITERSERKIPQVKAKLVHQQTKRSYEVISYAEGSVNSDAYYDENLVLGDIPPGTYTLYLDHDLMTVKTEDLVILPGQVTYFTYHLRTGFEMNPTPAKAPQFIPPDITPAPP